MKSLHKTNKVHKDVNDFSGRRKLVLSIMLGCMLVLVFRAFDLQVVNNRFLQNQGQMRHVSTVKVSAYRGKIFDRKGDVLAISTPVQSVWVNPQQFSVTESGQYRQLAQLLGLTEKQLQLKTNPDTGRKFVYLQRRVSPSIAEEIKEMQLSGVNFGREFKRFYPLCEVTSHLLGFNNIDDIGQEGLELLYEKNLKGTPGLKRVIRDGKRQIIGDVEDIKRPVNGQDLVLSIDQQLQALAYRELKLAVNKHKAHAGSLVALDAKTGEVLAMVNQPAFNPNSRVRSMGGQYRNRAVTDVFEPGSTVKPFVVAAALDGGYVSPDIEIETHGFFRVGRNLVRDVHNYGTLNLTQVLKKSSNVAASKLALAMPSEYFWRFYNQLGFGASAGVGFPGEASGTLLDFQQWHDFEKATLSFGYGLSTSTLQLARAYTALADDGVLHTVSLLKRDQDFDARQVMSRETARQVRLMLEEVVKRGGTAYKARVDGYRVAGKTGTVKKASAGGYSSDSYLAIFVGMAPASDPRLIIAVVVDEPTTGGYYGGLVAGPVFAKVMRGALRLLRVPPDQEETMPTLLVSNNG